MWHTWSVTEPGDLLPVRVAEKAKSIELQRGHGGVDCDLARRIWRGLGEGPDHGEFCACPSCLCQLHQSRGGRYDRESFFLYWLEEEVVLAGKEQIEQLIFGRGGRQRDRERVSVEWREWLLPSRPIPEMARILRQCFPDIDPNPRRIKVKLWRFKRSGIAGALEEEIRDRERRATPPAPEAWQNLRLAQRIADLVYSRPKKTISQRDLQRLARVPVDRLEELRAWLNFNYGIEARQGRRKGQVLYRGRMKGAHGRALRVGVFLKGRKKQTWVQPPGDRLD